MDVDLIRGDECCDSSASLFISTWATTDTITLPLGRRHVRGVANVYDFTVYWGDGTSTEVDSASEGTHTIAVPAPTRLSIDGTIKGFPLPTAATRRRSATSVNGARSTSAANGGGYFSGASSLTATATDAPDLAGTTDLSSLPSTVPHHSTATSATGTPVQ